LSELKIVDSNYFSFSFSFTFYYAGTEDEGSVWYQISYDAVTVTITQSIATECCKTMILYSICDIY